MTTPQPTPQPSGQPSGQPAEPTPLPDAVPEAVRRRLPSTIGGLIYLIVVLATAGGFALVAFGPWRRGITLVGVAFLAAACARGTIVESEAGMLRVRGRAFDMIALAGVGIALIVLATNIPDQPGL